MGLSFDGLASGLDTTAIIDALMDVEAIPRTLLSAKSDDRRAVISQLQSLNTALQKLVTTAKDAGGAGATAQVKVTSSHDSVTLTAAPGSAAVSTQIVVDRTAAAHTVVSQAVTAFPDQPLVFTVETAAGDLIEVRPLSSAPADVARALSTAGAGIVASAVAAGVTADGQPLSRLQLTATETGSQSVFRIHLGDAAAVAAGTSTDLATQPGAAVVTQGQDAQVRLWAGTAAEQAVTSPKNTFTDLFAGVDVTVARATDAPVSLTVATDPAARATAAGGFVSQIAAMLAGIAKGSAATTPGSAGGTTTLGVFTGDSTVRALRQALSDAVQFPVDGVSPSTIGVSIDRYGVLSFDEKKFRAAVDADPAAAEALFAGVAARVQQVASQYSDKYDGLLTARITGQESEVTRMSGQLERWDLRLDQRRASLERTYASLETMLARLQSQSSYLTSQLASLPSSNRSGS
ncbi:flagellar filament capping protein FliD [Microbacterium sp. zg.Y1090]|uniref:flagellar filament capping protein FliD n=1 Tax=Microbacterium TaxID=33882 RepID=UPI00214D133A|nr:MULTISPECIES: flagellar filament capping protein FliD [unclassified Microbacterium]MCR2813972.1 flagellar filament capping protein FliD [Microbacterium sp. zg.Y1084]MCR2819246.1 flagellar filament capping protein FliD [Microbacterium sp. zg.Y1090]MDL5487163.1 flagellar filament capping protein FliD [Microbacterium sp. zg-Y1211]WIM28228.1 flagellar filament capping protein FliD [Microbacterium sp. zg-Y1090]